MKIKAVLIFLLAFSLLLGGCSSSGNNNNTPQPAQPDPVVETPEVWRPETVYYSDLGVSQQSKDDMSKAGVQITASRFTYYEDEIGRIQYHLIIEWQNNGKTPLLATTAHIVLYDTDHNQVNTPATVDAVYGIMSVGQKDYLYSSGYIYKEDMEKLNYDISKGLIPYMEGTVQIQECQTNTSNTYTFVKCETEFTRKTLDDGRIAFSGTITNPIEKDFPMYKIHFLLYDALGSIIAVQPGYIRDLNGKQTADIPTTVVLNWAITPDMIAEVKVAAQQRWYNV